MSYNQAISAKSPLVLRPLGDVDNDYSILSTFLQSIACIMRYFCMNNSIIKNQNNWSGETVPISKIETYFGKSPSLGARFLLFSLAHSSEFLLLGWCPHEGLPEKAIKKLVIWKKNTQKNILCNFVGKGNVPMPNLNPEPDDLWWKESQLII